MDLTRWRELRWQASALRANIQLKTQRVRTVHPLSRPRRSLRRRTSGRSNGRTAATSIIGTLLTVWAISEARHAEKGTDLFFALCRTPLASPLHAHAELAVDLINKPLASSELPALQGLSNEHQL